MAGYLDQYGAGDERRSKIIKTIVISLLAVIVVGGTLTFIFYNYRQEQQVKRFFELVAARDYQPAYAMWVRTEQDRHGYSFDSFMQDWGPQGEHGDVTSYHIAKSRSCGSGVILTVDFGKSPEAKLWVQRSDLTIGFSPYPGCPAGGISVK
jgi:hypothetical protein